MPDPINPFTSWCDQRKTKVGIHRKRILTEKVGSRQTVTPTLLEIFKRHYVDPAILEKRLKSLGAPKTAAFLRANFPKTIKARSGDVGEILATEYTLHELGFIVPVLRLRWKDGREMALRGDDIVALRRVPKGIELLKGESKSRKSLSKSVLDKATEALASHDGRPTPHTMAFIANRLREIGKDDLALIFENLTVQGFSGTVKLAHLLFTLSGNDPHDLLIAQLSSVRPCICWGVGIHIPDHQDFISSIYEALNA